MRKMRTILCLLLLALTIPAAHHLKQELPRDAQPMIEKKYGGWSGVLRLWVCEGWPTGSGSAAAWLNRCAASFEKRHPGVYVQPEYVEADALEAERVLSPDLMLFCPGVASPDRFAPLDIDISLRNGLPLDERAAPVLLGAYMWAYNTSLIEGIPGTWRDAGVDPVASADDSRLWSAALLALCSSKYSEDAPGEAVPQGMLELGLLDDISANTPTPAPTAGTLDCRLPEGFTPSADAWRSFTNGEAAAMPVTPREIRRLEALSDQGKGPDWRLAGTGELCFTDQVLYIGMLDQEDPDKLDLCRAFVEHLLTDACQSELHRIGAFSVTGVPSGYAPGNSLAAMEQLLDQKPLLVPAPFDADWREDADNIVRDFWRDDRSPAAILAQLADRLRR